MSHDTSGFHVGIELRATFVQITPGEFMHANSDALHFIAQQGAPGPDRTESDWVETIPQVLDGDGRPWLRIEHRAVLLPNEYPDAEAIEP